MEWMRPRRSTHNEDRGTALAPRHVSTTVSGLYSATLFVMLRWRDGLDRCACVARRSPRRVARTGSRRGRARTVASRPNCIGPGRRGHLGTDRHSAPHDPTGRAGVLHPRCPHRGRRQRRHARAAARRDRGHRTGGRRGTGRSTATRRALRCRREGRHRRQRIRLGGHSAWTVTPHRRRMASAAAPLDQDGRMHDGATGTRATRAARAAALRPPSSSRGRRLWAGSRHRAGTRVHFRSDRALSSRASMNSMPRRPSSTVGKSTASGSGLTPARRARMVSAALR